MRGAFRLVHSVLHSLFAAQLSLATKTKLLLMFLLTAVTYVQLGYGATINVTTTQWRVSGGPGCSLQEAIWAANLQTSLALSGVNSDGSDSFVVTNCTAGDGNDTIVLPIKGVFVLTAAVPDIHSILGPTANPIVFSNITIEGNGAQLWWLGAGHARAFSVGGAFVPLPGGGAATGTGNLILRNLYIVGFTAKGGDGASGGGGGMGAGGAIFVKGGSVTVENSTFSTNSAVGGKGSTQDNAGFGGGGGGLGGNGGAGVPGSGGGGGGGGSGGDGGSPGEESGAGGGGGGTLTSGFSGLGGLDGGQGGFNCGGNGGGPFQDGSAAPCPGGGGGGGGQVTGEIADICIKTNGGTGGAGNYGGGGGGGGFELFDESGCTFGSPGGNGGFGGGGGAAGIQEQGGSGGFGGGGGASGNHPGKGGTFGGDANDTNGTLASNGGGGAGLGGAIFSDNGTVIVRNGTFTRNLAAAGSGGKFSGLTPGADGSDAGGAIFMLNGSLSVENSTFANNAAAGSSGGIQIYQLGSTPTSFTLLNTIIYGNNGLNEFSVQANSVTSAGIVGNLIQNNDPLNPCLVNGSGVVSTLDPGLGPLQDNGGYTPTIAITKGLTAWGTADPATSLATDQRAHQRPSEDGHGFDIGAFELCTPSNPLTGSPCRIVTIAEAAALTMQVSPANGGTTNPPVGVTNYPLNSIAPIQATPAVGFVFANPLWTGNVTDPTNPSTTVIMNQDQTVTANFVAGACVTNLAAVGASGSALAPPRVDLAWTQIGSAASYSVMRSTIADGPYSAIGGSIGSTFSDTNGLTNGDTYYYVLQPKDANSIEICQSNQATVSIPAPRHR